MQRTRIIKTGCIIAAVVFLLSAMLLDSNTDIPIWTGYISLIWLCCTGATGRRNDDKRRNYGNDEQNAGGRAGETKRRGRY